MSDTPTSLTEETACLLGVDAPTKQLEDRLPDAGADPM